MTASASILQRLPRAAAVVGLLAVGRALSGCTGMSDAVSTAFADPAKYELWDCKQLEPERKALARRAAELEGLMAKAETGVAGPVVAEMAYRNDYVAVRGQAHFAEEAWRKNKCHETLPAAAAPAAAATGPAAPAAKPPMSKAGSPTY
jgi:hypothetical protein